VTVPKTYVPYLTVVAAFGTGVGTALSQGEAVLPAILFALMGLATGTGLSHHFGTPARTQSMTEGNSGKPPASSTPSSTAANVAGITSALMLVLALGATSGCNGQPVVPTFLNLVSVVAADLEAGDGDAQISSDVCKALGGSALTDAVCGSVGMLIVDIVTYLIDSGTLSAPAQKRAQGFLASHPKVSK